ncbi:MAG: AAA family ATPase [Butyricicoccus sp.]
MLKVILVASGKGGTGKTSLTAGVGAALAQLGSKVLLIDGDCGLRNLDIVLGMSDRVVYSFADVAGGAVPLADAMACHPDMKTLYLPLHRWRFPLSASAAWSSWLCRPRRPGSTTC